MTDRPGQPEPEIFVLDFTGVASVSVATSRELYNAVPEKNEKTIEAAIRFLKMNKNKFECFEWLIVAATRKLGSPIMDPNLLNTIAAISLLSINEAERRILSGEAK